MSEPLTYTVAEAAELLGISAWTYYDRLKRGDLPGRQIGRRWVVPKIQLDQWLAKEGAA